LKAVFSRVQAAALQEVKERGHRETSMLLLQTSSLIDKFVLVTKTFLLLPITWNFSSLFDAFQLPSVSRFVEQAFAPYLLTSTITAWVPKNVRFQSVEDRGLKAPKEAYACKISRVLQ
jgi:hypothetical protein